MLFAQAKRAAHILAPRIGAEARLGFGRPGALQQIRYLDGVGIAAERRAQQHRLIKAPR